MPHSFPTRLSSALHLALGRSRGGVGIGIGAADHLFDFGRQFGGGIAGLFQRDLHGAAAAQFAAAHAEDAVGTAAIGRQLGGGGADLRSEEHTSELQSLMRLSYAVFCLKKKK